eukprot:EG_transcript_12364
MAVPSSLFPIRTETSQRRTSCLSDSGSSECPSIPSIASSPTVRLETPIHLLNHAIPPCLGAAAGSHLQPLAAPSSPAVAALHRGSELVPSRPLCLDFLNGKCRRQRAYCRYYHPQPEEVTLLAPATASPDAATATPAAAGTVNDPTRPVCEVWALTGFCKYGPRCWKQHPQLSVQLSPSVAEPITYKFQQWLQSRLQEPSSPALTNSRNSAPSPTSRRSSVTSFEIPRSPLSDGNSSSGLLTLAQERMKSPSMEGLRAASTTSPSPPLATLPAPGTGSGFAAAALPPSPSVGDSPATAVAPAPTLRATADPPFVHQPYAL